MAVTNIEKSSWLNLTRLLELNGTLFWDATEYPEIPHSMDDVYIQLTDVQSKRIDQVSYQYYGESNYMWIIMLANDKYRSNDFYGSEQIRIPAKTTIDSLMKKKT